MKKTFFISATNTDVGKTYASAHFLEKYTKLGYKVGYFKPIETGVIEVPLDGGKMLELCKKLNPDFKASIADVVPYQFKLPASPFVSKGDTKLSIDFIKEKKDFLLKFCDILIIEGAGGLMVPLTLDYFMIDLAKDLQAPIKLITPAKLGCINDTLLSLEMLKKAKLSFEWYINLHNNKEEFCELTLPFYKKYFDDLKFI